MNRLEQCARSSAGQWVQTNGKLLLLHAFDLSISMGTELFVKNCLSNKYLSVCFVSGVAVTTFMILALTSTQFNEIIKILCELCYGKRS